MVRVCLVMKKCLLVFLFLITQAYAEERIDAVTAVDKKQSYTELFDDYIFYRKTIWQITPPLGLEPDERLSVSENREGWYEKAWARWMKLPGWFINHSAGSSSLSEPLQKGFWDSTDQESLWVWEDPGKRKLYIGKETKRGFRVFAQRKAPDWVMEPGESEKEFYVRELATRRIAWRFDSPYLPKTVEEEPLAFAVMSMSAPAPLELSWDPQPPDVSVNIDTAVSQGPFTLWEHNTGDLRGSQALPGDWTPMHWQKELPASPWLAALSFGILETFWKQPEAIMIRIKFPI